MLIQLTIVKEGELWHGLVKGLAGVEVFKDTRDACVKSLKCLSLKYLAEVWDKDSSFEAPNGVCFTEVPQ